MEFEKAIKDAATMFLFDRRSQQQLHEMAEAAAPNSRDRFLIRMTQAAFIYYNAFDGQGWEISAEIAQASAILRDVKRFRQDRIFYTLALRLEVDLLLHSSRLHFQGASKKDKGIYLFNDDDAKALSICNTLLKNLPTKIDPLPNTWYSSLIPLVPSFSDQVLKFYGDRVKENRIDVLQSILKQIRAELIMASGIIMAKRFLAATKSDFSSGDKVPTLLLASVREVMARLYDKMPAILTLISDVSLPKGISRGQLELGLTTVEKQIQAANQKRDIRALTGSLLQAGILNFLQENSERNVKALVSTLRASDNLDEELKKIRQYRHREFPDIPFMIGTSFLRMALTARENDEEPSELLRKSKNGLYRALSLQPAYHQAYVNLGLAMKLSAEPGLEEMIQMYLAHYDDDIAKIDAHLFRNLALLEFQGDGSNTNPKSLQWLIASFFCLGGELTRGKQMLQELKTLYILNAHSFSLQYLEAYRSALRLKDEEFIQDLQNNGLHSAMLFYIAHAYTSLSLSQEKNKNELSLNHDYLNQAIELNSDALFFNAKNGSAFRLVETQLQILQFALRRTEKRWERINNAMSNRFQYYEEYLRQEKTFRFLKERLNSLKLELPVPELKISQNALLRMDVTLSSDQRERLRHRVDLT